jgi:hypothetical protein
MPRFFHRIAALLLIPCLAFGAIPQGAKYEGQPTNHAAFESQALAEEAFLASPGKLHVPLNVSKVVSALARSKILDNGAPSSIPPAQEILRTYLGEAIGQGRFIIAALKNRFPYLQDDTQINAVERVYSEINTKTYHYYSEFTDEDTREAIFYIGLSKVLIRLRLCFLENRTIDLQRILDEAS